MDPIRNPGTGNRRISSGPANAKREPKGEGTSVRNYTKQSVLQSSFTNIFKRGVEFFASKGALEYKSLKAQLANCITRAERGVEKGDLMTAISELRALARISQELSKLEAEKKVSQRKVLKLSGRLSAAYTMILERCADQCATRATASAQKQDIKGTLEALRQLEKLRAMESHNSAPHKSDQLKVKNILNQRPNLDPKGEGDSVLMMCIHQGNPLEDIKLLIKYGAHVNFANTLGSSPLSRAIDTGDAELIEFLLQSGARVSEKLYSKALFLLDDTITDLLKNNGLSRDVTDKLDALFLERVFSLKMGIDCLYGCEKNPYSISSRHAYQYYATGFVDSFYNYLRKHLVEDSPGPNTVGSIFKKYSHLSKLSAEECAEAFAKGEIFSVPLTIPNHLVTVTFYPPHYCSVNDRSAYTIEGTEPGVNIYKIPEDALLNEETWNVLTKPQTKSNAFNKIFSTFQRVDHIPQTAQSYNNCSMASIRSGVLASLVFFKYNQLILANGGKDQPGLLEKAKQWARPKFDTWKVDDRLSDFKKLKKIDSTNKELLRISEQKLIKLVALNQGIEACLDLINQGIFSREEALRVAVRSNNADLLQALMKEDLESSSWLGSITYSMGLSSLKIKAERLDFYEGLMHMAMLRGNIAVLEVMEAMGTTMRDHLKPTESKATLLLDKSKAWPIIDAKVADTSFEATSEHLHLAIDAGYPEMVEFILENGADPEAEILPGCTPLFLAKLYGHQKIVEILEEAISR